MPTTKHVYIAVSDDYTPVVFTSLNALVRRFQTFYYEGNALASKAGAKELREQLDRGQPAYLCVLDEDDSQDEWSYKVFKQSI